MECTTPYWAIDSNTAKGLEELYLQASPSIIHRDIKSDNILLSKDFEPKVSDFGSAKIAPDGNPGSGLVGTIGYMALEVANCISPLPLIVLRDRGPPAF
jgi:serine/threonine protein kinase